MATTHIYLKGGPCNGRTVSADQIVGGLVAYIKCGGGYYTDQGAGTRPNGDLIWSYAGKTQPGPPGGTGSGEPANMHKGWDDVRRTLNKRSPKALDASDKMTAAALRSLSRARKVRL